MKLNCWEFKKCGREPGGKNVDQFGVCPAASRKELNGINSGKNGGRACWALAGTLCNGTIQTTFAGKFANCMHCFFYIQVLEDEGVDFVPSLEIHERLANELQPQLRKKPVRGINGKTISSSSRHTGQQEHTESQGNLTMEYSLCPYR